MSEENESSEEEKVTLAPGLEMALYPSESEEPVRRRGPDPLAGLRMWSLEPDLEGWLGKEKS